MKITRSTERNSKKYEH